MTNIKEFCKKYKGELIMGGCVIGAAVIGGLIANELIKVPNGVYAGKSVISWVPNGNFIDLERVKEILDLNADNSSVFAIVKEGMDKQYSLIVLSEDVITGV